MSGGTCLSHAVPCSQRRWKIIFAAMVTHGMRPRGSLISAESDNTSRLVISGSSKDNSVEENQKCSRLELYSIPRVLTKLSELPRAEVFFVLLTSGEIEFKTSHKFESHFEV